MRARETRGERSAYRWAYVMTGRVSRTEGQKDDRVKHGGSRGGEWEFMLQSRGGEVRLMEGLTAVERAVGVPSGMHRRACGQICHSGGMSSTRAGQRPCRTVSSGWSPVLDGGRVRSPMATFVWPDGGPQQSTSLGPLG